MIQVPEFEPDFSPAPNFGLILEKVEAGQHLLGKNAAIPMIIGVNQPADSIQIGPL